MFEARISFKCGRKHTIEANTLDMLKTKCKPFVGDERIYDIFVVKTEGVGWIKSDISPKLII